MPRDVNLLKEFGATFYYAPVAPLVGNNEQSPGGGTRSPDIDHSLDGVTSANIRMLRSGMMYFPHCLLI